MLDSMFVCLTYEWIIILSQIDIGVSCFSGSSADDEATKPLHSFDKNLFDLCKVPADQIAVSVKHEMTCCYLC